MEVLRDRYLGKLIRKKHNGMTKIITGISGCGKTYLLFNLFYNHLLASGVKEDHIIKIALDEQKDKKYLNPHVLCDYVHECVKDKDMYYILLDEIQLVENFEGVLNSFLHIKNADTYVIGSFSKRLAYDVITEFRGRGDNIHVYPLSFSEFMSVYDGDKYEGLKKYITYGGLPKVVEINDDNDKEKYLKRLIDETYMANIIKRNDICRVAKIKNLLHILSSCIGLIANPLILSDMYKSDTHVSIHARTITKYLDYLLDAFLIAQVKRRDLKGSWYRIFSSKYYFTDTGLRNAILGFNQEEEIHIIENIVCNELILRGLEVNVGVIEHSAPDAQEQRATKESEIGFVCDLFNKRYYIKVASYFPSREKQEQERQSFLETGDFFKKIIIVKDYFYSHYNQDGIYLMSLFDFLLDPHSLDF